MAKEKEIQETQKNSKNKIFLIGVPLLIFLIVGGGLAAYFLGNFTGFTTAEAGSSKDNPKVNDSLGPLLKMEDFVVNIMHKDTTRFLKMGITLEAKNNESSERIKKRMPQITDAVLLLVGNKNFDQIKDLQGKLQLKADLIAHLNSLLGIDELNDIFFTDFVVQ
ncbi:MAG: flagellar basal body-associated FliL family protein [Desulfobacterales bacterium]